MYGYEHLSAKVDMMLELNEQVVPKKDPDKILRAMLGGYIFGPLWAIEVTLDGLGRLGYLRPKIWSPNIAHKILFLIVL